MFVGREKELSTLNKLYSEGVFQMVVLYGRRRIGKTTLITEFIQNKPAVLFTAQEVNDAMNLDRLSKQIYSFFKLPETMGAFKNWMDAMLFLAEKVKEQQFILVFDEFPYAASANRSLKSILQTVIDHKLKDSGLFLILCGSHMAFMENEVLGYQSPLFGRRTAQIKLEGFDYLDAAKLLSGFNNEDKIKFYACVGGTPHYLSQIKPNETFEENIKRLFFDIAGYLYNEPMMLLQQELREPAMYNSIISAIACGASRINEISTKIDEESSKVNKYLQTLVNLRIITKEFPFGDNPGTSRKGVYRIEDNCYNFWYSFVFPNRQEIERGLGDLIADTEVFGDRLSTYIGKPPFEQICLQYLIRLNRLGKLPFTANSLGSWWGNDPVEKAQSDVDVIAANNREKKIILGECKWKNSSCTPAEIQKLISKDHILREFSDRYYFWFSKAPFSESVKSMSSCRVSLITGDMLFELF